MKCTRQRCRDHQAHPLEPALHQAAEEGRPEGAILRRTDVDPEHLSVTLDGDTDRHDRRLTDDATIDPHLMVRRIHPQIAMLPGERPRPEGGDDRIELAANERDLRFRDPVDAQRFHQVVNLPGGHTVHVRFLDDREQRVLSPPARL